MKCERKMVDRRVVFLLRHGDSRQDHLKRYVGHTDTILNEKGRAQAEVLCRELAGISFSRLYCSTLQRSVETAKLIAGKGMAVVTQVPELCEISMGLWDGRSMEEVQSAYPDEYRRRGDDPAHHSAPGGESFAELQDRVIPAFEKILRDSEGPVLIVGHAGVNRVLLAHLIGMPLGNLFRLGQDYACLNVLVREKGLFRVHAMNLSTLAGCNGAFPNGVPPEG
ncbi:MAG: histidine phosphatase family protein [Geobacteraceae bacterium]|nr:histidine phosphatase family protein [Geobacteraceae bacterium]